MGRKKERKTHAVNYKKSVGKGWKTQQSIITVIMEGGSTCGAVMQFIVSC
jgi:hypothetical protein